jgi:hypothetical protein
LGLDGYGVLTLRPGMCCSPLVSMCIVSKFYSWKKNGKTKRQECVVAWKAHSQYAGKAPAVREAEQSREYDRYCAKRQHDDGEPFPSFPPAAAMITNT